MAIGSPVSVVITNFVMKILGERALESYTNPPLFWKRHVDDVCCAITRDEVSPFLQHLNSIEPSIQFTCEIEDAKQHLAFWDVSLVRSENG